MRKYMVYRLTDRFGWDFIWFGPQSEPLAALCRLANAYAAGRLNSPVAVWYWALAPIMGAEATGLTMREARAAAKGGTLNGPGRLKGAPAAVVAIDPDLTVTWYPTVTAAAGGRTRSAIAERLGRIDHEGRLYVLASDWGIECQKE